MFRENDLADVGKCDNIPPFASSRVITAMKRYIFIKRIFNSAYGVMLLCSGLSPRLVFRCPIRTRSLLLVGGKEARPVC